MEDTVGRDVDGDTAELQHTQSMASCCNDSSFVDRNADNTPAPNNIPRIPMSRLLNSIDMIDHI